VVVKKSEKKYAQSGRTRAGNVPVLEDVIRERDIMLHIQDLAKQHKLQGSKYICRLLDFFETSTHYWTILEDCEEGELFQFLQKGGKPFDDTTAKIFFSSSGFGSQNYS